MSTDTNTFHRQSSCMVDVTRKAVENKIESNEKDKHRMLHYYGKTALAMLSLFTTLSAFAQEPASIEITRKGRLAIGRKDPKADMSTGVIQVMNVYEGEFPMPEGVTIKELRIVNIFPKATPRTNDPNIGCGNQTLTRGVLGTVPVEDDGSVHFKMPTGISVYFQALDENGIVVQTMRSSTYVHPGETLACIGCHERKSSTPKAGRKLPTAIKRAPSEIKPEAEGSYPLSFARLVQPVLDKKCVECHEKNRNKKAPSLRGDEFSGKHGWSEAFNTLQRMAWRKHGGNGVIIQNQGSYSVPGKVGARESKLYKHLTKKGGHHDLELTPEEMRRITLWLDCNSNFYGAYLETEKQARGEIVKPQFGLPPWIEFEKLVR